MDAKDDCSRSNLCDCRMQSLGIGCMAVNCLLHTIISVYSQQMRNNIIKWAAR